MVTINLTMLVEVGLFLLFLWLMNAYVFRPILKVMDSRDDQLAEDRKLATTVDEEAAQLEKEYSRKVAAVHRDASHNAVHAHRVAQDAHQQKVRDLKKEEEEVLAATRKEAMAQIETERQGYDALALDLAASMARQLGLEGSGS